MNASDQLPPDANSEPLDTRLREAFDFLSAPPDAVPPPPPRLWAGVEAGLRPVLMPRRRTVGQPVFTGIVGVLLGLLVMWGALRPATGPAPRPHLALATPPHDLVDQPNNLVAQPNDLVDQPNDLVNLPHDLVDQPNDLVAPHGSLTEALVVAHSAAVPSVPAVLEPLVQAETVLGSFFPTDSSAETRAVRRRALLTERAALAALTHRTDSLLLTLGVLPEAPPALAPPPAESVGDSVPPAPLHRWSVAVAFAPERNFFGLQSAAGDTLSALRRTHEMGRAGFNAAALAEYRLSPRWSVGAGLGVASYGAELRLTDRRTNVAVAYDTQTTHTTQTTLVEWDTYSLRIVVDSVPSPIFNANYQIIGYELVAVPRQDTVWTHLVTTSTIVKDSVRTTPTVTTRQEVSSRILQPNYRFLTVPLLIRYRFGTEGGTFRGASTNRWWADVAFGAQTQFFLGGTQLVSADGRTWRTERVRAGQGPFRPLTVALTGALALNYALTPRLSASLAPTLRYQTESVYKAATGLTQRPAASGVMMGLKLVF